jgi:predicted acylesterase/phospholipase RssA
MTVAIALGGGAPNLTLMTGALLALDEAGVEFKVMTTTGAGMVAGLLYAAPRLEEGEDWKAARRRALRGTREMGIDDLIYDQMPVNYKIFQKPGKLAEAYAHVMNPVVLSIPRETRRQRLLGDMVGFAAAMMQPSDLKPSSQGLCQPPPWIEIHVDFSQLAKNLEPGKRTFRLTAYCIEDGDERTFDQSEITAEHFKAALAMPFIYAPYKMDPDGNGEVKTWLEGSAFRTMELNPGDVMSKNDVTTLIYFDLMGNDKLIGEPRNLVDAWGKSIVAPLTQIAQHQLAAAEMKMAAVTLLNQYADTVEKLQKLTWKLKKLVDEEKLAGKDKERDALIAKIDKMIDEQRDEINKEFDDRVGTIVDRLDGDSDLAAKIQAGLEQRQEAADRKISRMKQRGSDHKTDRQIDEVAEELEEQLYKAGEAAIYQAIFKAGREELSALPNMIRMPFRDHIPDDYWPKVLDWSHSNMSYLFDRGYETAQAFIDKNWEKLGLKAAPSRAVYSMNKPA